MARVTIRPRPGTQTVDDAAVARVARSGNVRRDLDRRAVRVAAYVRLRTPMRTGRLRSSVRVEDTTAGRGDLAVRVLIGRGVPYAPYWTFGARPHVIVPRRAKALRFTQGGQVRFARRVFHPGNAPIGVKVLTDSTRFWRD